MVGKAGGHRPGNDVLPTFPTLQEYDLSLRAFNVPSAPRSTTATIPFTPQEVVGRTIHVTFDIESAEGDLVVRFFRGTIRSFRAATGKHTVAYSDGEVSQDDLTQEVVVWAPGVVTTPGAAWPSEGREAGPTAGEAPAPGGAAGRRAGVRAQPGAPRARGRRHASSGGDSATGGDSGSDSPRGGKRRRRWGSAGSQGPSMLAREGGDDAEKGPEAEPGEAAETRVAGRARRRAAARPGPAGRGEAAGPSPAAEPGGLDAAAPGGLEDAGAPEGVAWMRAPKPDPEPVTTQGDEARDAAAPPAGDAAPVEAARPSADGARDAAVAVPPASSADPNPAHHPETESLHSTVDAERVVLAEDERDAGVGAGGKPRRDVERGAGEDAERRACDSAEREAAAEGDIAVAGQEGRARKQEDSGKGEAGLGAYTVNPQDDAAMSVEEPGGADLAAAPDPGADETAREMQAVLDQVAAAAPSPKALSAANGLAKSVNRCAKGTARLFGAGADGPLDQLHDASLGLALLSRGLVNGWRVETGAPSLPKDEALARRQTMQHTMQQRVQTATPGDEAVAVLAHALAPRRAPLDVAAGLEQQLWLDRKEADGAVGDAYLCALRTLWDVLSPQSEACRPLLTQALLQGSLAPSDLVRGSPEQLQDAEHRTVRALGSESQSLAGEGAPPLPPGHGGPAGEHACATLPSVTAMDCDD
ncbi:hypothetical protein F751_1931 [Auxenochlorella protothecoides]|uniref:Uncharacterized protein n=1 Tax=Auxenochlorella protothecoides TaxID=3075 RepID=A0A087SH48_AUXPR|nr:hypothetical protein F751_1931 [Auxenochlorella protothecoides]KFM25052.1 hypothetical protein F751_1931 [Auxenochlorella protothecoides]